MMGVIGAMKEWGGWDTDVSMGDMLEGWLPAIEPRFIGFRRMARSYSVEE